MIRYSKSGGGKPPPKNTVVFCYGPVWCVGQTKLQNGDIGTNQFPGMDTRYSCFRFYHMFVSIFRANEFSYLCSSG